MSRPLGAPGEFICMQDAHWVTLSRLLKKLGDARLWDEPVRLPRTRRLWQEKRRQHQTDATEAEDRASEFKDTPFRAPISISQRTPCSKGSLHFRQEMKAQMEECQSVHVSAWWRCCALPVLIRTDLL